VLLPTVTNPNLGSPTVVAPARPISSTGGLLPPGTPGTTLPAVPAVAAQGPTTANQSTAGLQLGAQGNLGLSVLSQNNALTVSNVAADQFAARAGFLPGDQIVSVNGGQPGSSQQFVNQLGASLGADGTAIVRVNRGGQAQTLRLDVLGLRLGTEFANQGRSVQLAGIGAGTPAANAGLIPGDEIVTINGQAVSSVRDARSQLSAAANGAGETTLMVRRGGALEFFRVRPGDVVPAPAAPANAASGM
jgi:S1-C subfamily serine protease